MRKLFKKSLACLLAAIFCVTLCVAAVPASAEAPTYSTNAVEAKAGETVNIDFTVSNFINVKGAMIKLTLPEVVASITDVNLNGADLAAFDAETGNGYYQVNGKEIKFLSLFGFAGELDAVATLTFNITATIAEDAAEGTYTYADPYFSVTEDGETLVDVAGTFGEFEIIKEEVIEKFDIPSSSMTLDASLLFNFFVNKADITDTGSYAVITKKYADGREDKVTEVPFSEWVSYNKDTQWKIPFSGIAAKEVNDDITCEIADSKGNIISNPKTDSIRGYLLRLYNAYKVYTQPKFVAATKLSVDLLYFCAGAQQQFKYDLDDLATNYITEEMAAIATTEATAENKQVKGDNYYATVMSIEDRNVLKMYFKNVDTSSMYAIYTYTDFRGREQSFRVEGKDFVQYNKTNYYGPEVDTLAYGDGYQLVTCTMYKADGTVHGTCVESIESTAARLITAYPDNTFYPSLMNIVVSMTNYALS